MNLRRVALTVFFFAAVSAEIAWAAPTATLYDTGSSSSLPLSTVAMGLTTMWTKVQPGKTDHSFSGDAVILSDELAVVVRRRGAGAEVYTKSSTGRQYRACLTPVGGPSLQGLAALTIVKNQPEEVALEAVFATQTGSPLGVRYALEPEKNRVAIEGLKATTGLRVEAPCSYGVIPFSSQEESLLIDASRLEAVQAEFFSENAFLQLAGNGDVILMTEWKSGSKDVRLTMSGTASDRQIRCADIGFDTAERLWVTALERRNAWDMRKVPTDPGGEEVEVRWRWPYDAPWLADSSGTGPYREFKAGFRRPEASPSEPFTHLYDTGVASAEPLTSVKLAYPTRWTAVPEGRRDYQFRGDAVLMNDKLAAVLRRDGDCAELYARRGNTFALHGRVAPTGAYPAQQLSSVTVVQNEDDAVVVEAFFSTVGKTSVGMRMELPMGQPFVKTEGLKGAEKLRVEAPSRFVVLPDFFADDIVIDARDIPVDSADLPSENFLLHMLGNGGAILMSVWQNRDQEVRVALDGSKTQRVVRSAEIAFGQASAIWVGLIADDGIWHVRDITLEDKGREIRLNWRWPFPALWRVDWRRSDKLTDSWEMLTQQADGSYKKHGLFSEEENEWTAQDWWSGRHPRRRITPGLGGFNYPCWVKADGTGFLEPMKEKLEFQGPAVLYPLNRLQSTPLDRFTVVDLVRATMGVGPCRYILDVEAHDEAFQGLPTCSIRDLLDDIYEKGRQKQQRLQVEQALSDVVAFISLIRRRIDQYETFAKEMLDYLGAEKQKKAHLSESVAEMETLTRQIQRALFRRKEAIKSIEHAQKLAEEFRVHVLDYEGTDALDRCRTYTKQWVDIGGNQDELVAECRMLVRLLRQRAVLAGALNPELVAVVDEVRSRTHTMLRNPVNYEAPHH